MRRKGHRQKVIEGGTGESGNDTRKGLRRKGQSTGGDNSGRSGARIGM